MGRRFYVRTCIVSNCIYFARLHRRPATSLPRLVLISPSSRPRLSHCRSHLAHLGWETNVHLVLVFVLLLLLAGTDTDGGVATVTADGTPALNGAAVLVSMRFGD
jgi:hypothetical protein